MKPTTVAFIQWLKHQAEIYLRIVDRDRVAMILWQQRRGFHWAWKSIEEQRVMREKLIRQVSYRIASIFNERLSRWPTVGERDEIRDKVAGEIVGLILSAVRDGLEIPGEEWRGPVEDMDSVALLAYDGIIIGLRGTGKEEEE